MTSRERSGPGEGPRGVMDPYFSKSTKRKKSKGKKGKRDQPKKKGCPFDQLPVELVTEILSHLEPKDLLAFSRTNKSCRSILMSKKQSNRIWKLARQKFNLPDLTADDFSEPAYAALLWDTQCDNCAEYRPAATETWLRVRLCIPCRKLKMVKIDAQLKDDPSYHPATFDCVKATPRTPNNVQYGHLKAVRYALLEEIDSVNKQLWLLQKTDDEDRAIRPRRSPSDEEAEQPSSRSSRREGLRTRSAPHSYTENDEGSAWIEMRPGGEVVKFVAARNKLLGRTYADGTRVRDAYDQALRSIQRAREDRILVPRLDALDNYDSSDLGKLHSRTLKRFLAPGQILTDELWTTVQPKLLSAIDSAKDESDLMDRRVENRTRAESRRRSCRPYYDALRSSFDPSTFFPLFTNFLLLPSVQPLLKEGDDEDNTFDTIDESEWKLLLPLITAEVEEYQVDCVTSVVRDILSAHREHESDENLEEAVQATLEGDLDSFFSLAASIVVCKQCPRHGEIVTTGLGGILSWPYRRYGGGLVGSVPDSVAHLFTQHNSVDDADLRGWVGQPTFPLHLPLQVASAVTALLEVGDSSFERAKIGDLDRLDSGRYEWENAGAGQRKRFGTWRSLVNAVSFAVYRAERRTPPVDLPAPSIAYYPPDAPRVQIDVDDSDDSDDSEA
ncbi:hypothetical protein JCM16303_004758 [Sporobolomyces ruberrimus]